MGLDLVTVWSIVLALGLALYVLLDGMYLGIEMLLLSARKSSEREEMIGSLKPFNIGNAVWLMLCVAGFIVTFPLAGSVFLQAFWLPCLLMLFGFLLRIIATKCLSKAPSGHQGPWVFCLGFGSVLATFCQGALIGAFMQGVLVEDFRFVGSVWDWLSWFSALTGITLILTYLVLGATGLLMPPALNKDMKQKMRHYSHHLLVWFGYAIVAVQLITPFLTDALRERWLGLPNFFYMGFVPMLGLMAYVWVYYVIRFSTWKVWPFSVFLIFLGTVYFTLIISLWPMVLPAELTIHNTAASESTLRLALWGSAIALPAIMVYLYRSYCVFYKKGSEDNSGKAFKSQALS